MSTSLLLSLPSPFHGLSGKKSQGKTLAFDHYMEGAQRAIRFAGTKLQSYQIEGDLITVWHELELDAPQANSLWKSIETDKLLKLDPSPKIRGTAPGIIEEQDDLALTVESEGLRHEIAWRQGAKPPPFVSNLMERLKSLVSQKGHVPGRVLMALLADNIDRPNWPATISIAEALKKGGVSFKDLEEIAPAERPLINQAIASADWLVAYQGPDSAGSTLAPLYVETGGRHFRIRRLKIFLVNEERHQ